jgi:cell wall-associated NlpC family hydrolase
MTTPRSIEEINERVVEAARSRVGKPYRNHFKPNECSYGYEVNDGCWTHGLDDAGYDCSGLVIASICDAIDLSLDKWPRNLRHIAQFYSAAAVEGTDPEQGDIVVCVNETDPAITTWHMGLYTGEDTMVHASGLPAELEVVEGPIGDIHTISVVRFAIGVKNNN